MGKYLRREECKRKQLREKRKGKGTRGI